jgi:ABC-2 type transport system ATP-binding protein
MSEYAIQTEALRKSYGKLRAVDGLDVHVPRGAVYGFLGRNGAGKTTTIKALLGLVHSDGGSASVLGMDVRQHLTAILERTAFVSENKILYDGCTPAELVRFNCGFFPTWRDDAAQKLARLLDIPMRRKYGKLSKGNRTKVCLLLALAQNSELLILDEPTAGLDPVMIDEVLRILVEDHVSAGRTIFFSTHQLSEVEQIADWVGIIDQGKLLLEAQLEDLRDQFRLILAAGDSLPASGTPHLISVSQSGRSSRYVVSRDAEEFAGQLRQRGAEILQISPLSLREVFLELVRKEEACTPGNAGAIPVSASSPI